MKRQHEFLGEFVDRKFTIYVDAVDWRDEHYDDLDYYDTFRLFFGTSPKLGIDAKLFSIPIRSIDGVIRLRDGGTTFIDTIEGMLTIPAPFLTAPPQWSTENSIIYDLKTLSTDDFTFTEIDEGAMTIDMIIGKK